MIFKFVLTALGGYDIVYRKNNLVASKLRKCKLTNEWVFYPSRDHHYHAEELDEITGFLQALLVVSKAAAN